MATMTHAEFDVYLSSGVLPVVSGSDPFNPAVIGWVCTEELAEALLGQPAKIGECHMFLDGHKPTSGAIGVWMSGAVFAKRMKCFRPSCG